MTVSDPGTDIPLRPARSPVVRSRDIAGERLLMHRELKQYHILNGTAGRIWDLADGTRTVGEISSAIAAEFNADPDRVDKDVRDTVDGMMALRLLAPATDGAGS
jgi:Coenzyme PQQ synthesis protein D (PqqD)